MSFSGLNDNFNAKNDVVFFSVVFNLQERVDARGRRVGHRRNSGKRVKARQISGSLEILLGGLFEGEDANGGLCLW